MTFPPSFWSMICASLGFASLLIVQAKPLRELGFGGVLGMPRTFNAERILLPRSRDIPLRPLLPADPLWSDEIRLKPKWESLDDQPLLEK